ncbi:hypothetical protein ACFWFR_00405 [Oerskovia sp. NPDC060287]|uniref:hypothetical protein n=1 Tax=Oerskovia sp. NPDC060287 TaxID=3347095 RepID=UPI00365A0ED8
MTSVEQASTSHLQQAGGRRRLVAGTALAAAAPTALIGWALNEYLYELKWLGSSSGWLDGRPDQLVVVAGTAGIVLLVGVAFGAYLLGARRTSSRRLSPSQTLMCTITGIGVPLVLLALVLLVWAAASPLTSTLVPVR